MIPANVLSLLKQTVVVAQHYVTVVDPERLRTEAIDGLVYEAVFGLPEHKPAARWLVWEIAQSLGIRPSSIHPLYAARGREILPTAFTVPAMNFRGMVYDTARALFATAVETNSKAFICELARGEMSYTDQTPAEYTSVLLAAAIKEGYVGPVFIQGDHFQAKCSATPGVAVDGEMEQLQTLIEEAITAGFYNIDIDASTLVRLNDRLVADQQAPNVAATAELLHLIRCLEPAGITISVGGEIGHIGGKNSTVADFTAFMEGLAEQAGQWPLISKISVATGTEHGGVVNRDGSMAPVMVDFSVIRDISKAARREYRIGGAVQHGASTLPDTMLHQFPPAGTLEIHLATGFQNLLMDHPSFPKELLTSMYQWLDQTKQKERERDWSDEQFHYKLRKKCWGQFKQQAWDLPNTVRSELRAMLSQRFKLIFAELSVFGSAGMVDEYVPSHEVHKEVVDFALPPTRMEVSGLSD